MALCAPWCRMAKKKECPCSTSSPADPKIESEDTKKMSKSQQLIDTRNALFTTFTFWFHFLDLLIKLMKMMLLYILYCPPPPCHVTARAILILGHSAFTELPLSPTHPVFLFGWRSGTLLPSCLPIGWRSGRLRLNMRSRVCPLEGEGGPGITSLYVGWQRAPRILVLVILMPHM